MKLSVIIPVYNEIKFISEILRLVKKEEYEKEIIVVDDASTDGTREFLKTINDSQIRVVFNDINRGKGYCLRKGIEHVRGDVVIIQDADLEYCPKEYEVLMSKIQQENADVVFGSRFLKGQHGFYCFHYLGNKVLSFIINKFFKTKLTDLMTCYKAIKTSIIRSLQLKENGFCIEIEIAVELIKRKYHIYEVPITYNGRTYAQGKKIGLRDFFYCIYWLFYAMK